MVASNVAYSSMRKAHLLVLDRRNTLKTTKTYCSKKNNNKSKTNKIDHQETETHPEEDNRGTTGKEGGYAAGEDVQSTLKSQSQCSDRLDQTE